MRKNQVNAQNVTIRLRRRAGHVVGQGYTVWEEWQVVRGRLILGRFDMEWQARKFAADQEVSPQQSKPAAP
jgi:hypothetical protein